MATIRALPEELIAHTLLFLGDLPAQHKLAMSHVCRRWRGAALSTSRFWATINIYDLRDFAALDALLVRSGTAALHFYIHAAVNYNDTDDANDDWVHVWIDDLIGEQLRLMVSHTSRLRHLELYFGVLDPFEKCLLRRGLHFPVLESLVIDRPSWVNESHVPTIIVNWVAPALRTLRLTQVHPDHGWNYLLQSCPLLERLSVKDCNIPRNDPLPFFVPSITVTTFSSIDIPGDPMVEHLMRGIGRVVLFEIEDRQNVRLRDDKGSERCMAIEGEFSNSLCLTDLWIYLCGCHSAATAVTSFTLTSENWARYADAFSAISPAANVELHLTRGLWDWRASRFPPVFVINPDGQDSGKGWDLQCNGARRVFFDVESANGSDLVPLRAVLMRIQATDSIELCLCIAEALSDWEQWINEAIGMLGNLNDVHHNQWMLCPVCSNGSH